MHWIYNDGGRKDAGYKGDTGDCVTRAISIATGRPYQKIYDLINNHAELERPGAKSRQGRRSHANKGVFKATVQRVMKDLGWVWHPTMGIGTGCKVHLRKDELLGGTIIVSLSKHLSTVIDGVIHDTYDTSRNGTRCVYGYWTPPTSM